MRVVGSRREKRAQSEKMGSGAALGVLTAAALCVMLTGVSHAQSVPPGGVPVVQPGAPGSPSRTLPPSTHAVLPQKSYADVEFMQGMIMHHGQAVEMTALIPSHTQTKEVRAIGARIGRTQADEMQFMKRWLAARGEAASMAMPGMPDMDMSGNAMPAMPWDVNSSADGGAAQRQGRGV